MLGTFNKEVLRMLPKSGQIHPRNVDKLLELGRLPFGNRRITEQATRYQKRKMLTASVSTRKYQWDFMCFNTGAR